MDKQLQQEDTVSADRKQQMIYVGPGKTRRISSVASRQNFNNEKFTRRKNKGVPDEDLEDDEDKKVDEAVIQPNGDTKLETGVPDQTLDMNAKGKKKSNNSQIEFVNGKQNPDNQSATGTQPALGIKRFAEQLVKKRLDQIKVDKHVGIEKIDELSNELLGRYKKAASDQATEADKAGDFKKGDKRYSGIIKATTKQFDNDMKKHQTEETKGQADRQIEFYKFLKRLKQAGVGIPVSKVVEEEITTKETTMSKTYAQFMEQLLEYTPGPGGVTRVQGRSYGAQYHDPEGDDDSDDKAPAAKAADEPKRGRGRPKGAKSGANQKVTSGKSYGGIASHSLNLPNSR